MTNEELAPYSRTNDAPPSSADAGFTVNSDGDLVYFMYFVAPDSDEVTETYVDCLSKQDEADDTERDYSAEEIAVKTISFFENKYSCAGICTAPLFYASRGLDAGIPVEPCLGMVQREIADSSLYLGITSLIIGILMFITWVMQYCLWKSY